MTSLLHEITHNATTIFTQNEEIMSSPKIIRISINARVKKSTALAFKKLADKDKRSLNKYVELIMEQEIERRQQ